MTELPLGPTIATEIRRYRLAKGWSVRRLAEECAALGMPDLTEPSLGNIERGQDVNAKRTPRRVLVEELPVIAKALGVPPVLLLFPLLRQETVELLPGQRVATRVALDWFCGDLPFMTTRPDGGTNPPDPQDVEAWRRDAGLVELVRRHDRIAQDILMNIGAREQARRRAERGDDKEVRNAGVLRLAELDEQIAHDERELRDTRNAMRAIPGCTPPPLTRRGLAHIDDMPHDGFRANYGWPTRVPPTTTDPEEE